MTDIVKKASAFAIGTRQRIDHRHKLSKLPYDVHLKAVVDLVSRVTDDPETLAAAWLHDIVEDTAVTLDEVEREFGSGVAQLVNELTGVSRPGEGSRRQRQVVDRAHLASTSPRAKTIKLADLCETARNMGRQDARAVRAYLGEMAALLDVLSEGHAGLLGKAGEISARLRKQAGPSSPSGDIEPPRASQWRTDELRECWTLLKSFTVGDLARPLSSVDESELAVLAHELGSSASASDPIAVRRGGEIRAYVTASKCGDETTVEAPRAMLAAQIIADSAPLSVMVHVLTRYDFAFVSIADKLDAVVSRADLEKPIGRTWLFGMVTLIELDFTRRIRARWSNQGWEAFLSCRRLEKARELREERSRRGHQADLLDCLQLADKGLILVQDPTLLVDWGYHSKRAAKAALQDLQSLRDHLAHSQAMVDYHWHQIAGISRRLDDWLTEHASVMDNQDDRSTHDAQDLAGNR